MLQRPTLYMYNKVLMAEKWILCVNILWRLHCGPNVLTFSMKTAIFICHRLLVLDENYRSHKWSLFLCRKILFSIELLLLLPMLSIFKFTRNDSFLYLVPVQDMKRMEEKNHVYPARLVGTTVVSLSFEVNFKINCISCDQAYCFSCLYFCSFIWVLRAKI